MEHPPLLTAPQLVELISHVSLEGTHGPEHKTHPDQLYREYLLSDKAVAMLGSQGPDYIVASLKKALPKVTGPWQIEIGINLAHKPAMIIYDAPCDLQHALGREIFSAEMRERIKSGNVVPVAVFPLDKPRREPPPPAADLGDAVLSAMTAVGLHDTPGTQVEGHHTEASTLVDPAPGRSTGQG